VKAVSSQIAPAAAAFVLIWVTTGCHRTTPAAAIDPAMASCIPPGAMILAGVDLVQLRASRLYRNLSPGTAAFTGSLHDVSYAVLAWSGSDLIAIARGGFREPPSGWESIAPQLAVWGVPDAVRSARERHRNRITGATGLLSYAEPLAAHNPIWAVASGAATVPLTGNVANLNRFLHSTEYVTVAGGLTDILSLNIAGICRSPGEAQHLERTLRAFLSLASLRSPGPLAQATVATEDRTVRLTFTASAGEAEKVLH